MAVELGGARAEEAESVACMGRSSRSLSLFLGGHAQDPPLKEPSRVCGHAEFSR